MIRVPRRGSARVATFSRAALALAGVVLGACNLAHPPPPPPPPSSAATPAASTAAHTAATPTSEPVPPTTGAVPMPTAMPSPSMMPPSPSAIALAEDEVVCGAALHCCEAAAHEARMAARMEGIDPHIDPRHLDPRHAVGLDGKDDLPGAAAAARHSAPAHLAAGCRELRSSPETAHATRCTEQIEAMRHAFREVHAPVPSACHVPDPSQMPPPAP